MKLIVQKDPFGCGVACVANILSIEYDDALNLFANGKDKALKNGFYCKEIVSVFKLKNLNYKHKYINQKIKRKIYTEKAIVFIKRSKKYPAGHYLCRINNVWFDSWINFPENDKKSGVRKRLPGKPIYLISPT